MWRGGVTVITPWLAIAPRHTPHSFPPVLPAAQVASDSVSRTAEAPSAATSVDFFWVCLEEESWCYRHTDQIASILAESVNRPAA